MKKVYIAVICLSAVLCCVFGILFFRETFFPESPVATPDGGVSFATQDEVFEAGESRVLTVENEADIISWESSDSGVAAVDSGGRVDARKAGTADITVTLDGIRHSYRLTVTEAQTKEKQDLFSTAITANRDIEQKNRSSGSERLPYEIQVNRKQNCVTVFTYDKDGSYTVPVRAMVCSCGKDDATDTGEFVIYQHTQWHPLVNDVFGQYASSFSEDLLFHSVPYTDLAHDTLKTEEFNKLGEAASKGCVRMAVSDCNGFVIILPPTRWLKSSTATTRCRSASPKPSVLPICRSAGIRPTATVKIPTTKSCRLSAARGKRHHVPLKRTYQHKRHYQSNRTPAETTLPTK